MPARQQFFKRSSVAGVVLIGLACVIILAVLRPAAGVNAPRFVGGCPADAITNLATSPFSQWLVESPFPSNSVWLRTSTSRTNYTTYWVNLDDHSVKGELLRGSPIFCNRAETKLLCGGSDSIFPILKQRIATRLEKLSGGRFKAKPSYSRSYWLLDLRNNRAKRIGSLSQVNGYGSDWHPSPDFRFGCNIPAWHRREFALCDLEQETMTVVTDLPGEVQGWWDGHRLLLADAKLTFKLYDVLTRQTTNLFPAGEIHQFLKQAELPEELEEFATTPIWTGNGYTFAFSARTHSLYNTYVMELIPQTPEPLLKRFEGYFQCGVGGQFNPDRSLYAYSGDHGPSGHGGDGSVHIRKVLSGDERILVAGDESKQFTWPRFYKNRVIYMKARQLWSIDLNGSNNFKLFELPREAATP